MRSEIEAVAACEPRRWGSVDAPPAPPASWLAGWPWPPATHRWMLARLAVAESTVWMRESAVLCAVPVLMVVLPREEREES